MQFNKLMIAILGLAACLTTQSTGLASEPGTQVPGPALASGVRTAVPDDRDNDRDHHEEGTWLGVQLGPVPAALAAHLQTGDGGLIVRNVFKDSPADEAGIERYDVIIEADGKKVSNDVRGFSQHVRTKKADDTLTLMLYRKGKETIVKITLRNQPDGRTDMKYPEDPDVLHRRDFGMRGKIFRPGPEGWIMEDLGELPDMDRFFKFETRVPPPPGDPNQAHRVDKEGKALDVRCTKDGTIEVRRYRGGEGKEKAEAKTYANMDDLRKADPEAADLLESARANREPFPPKDHRWREWRDRFFGNWRPGQQFGEQPDARMGDRWDSEQRRMERIRPPADPNREFRTSPGPQRPPGEPNVRFDVQPNGEITVHSRQHDAELNMAFKNKEAFKERAPELFKLFEEMEKKVK